MSFCVSVCDRDIYIYIFVCMCVRVKGGKVKFIKNKIKFY